MKFAGFGLLLILLVAVVSSAWAQQPGKSDCCGAAGAMTTNTKDAKAYYRAKPFALRREKLSTLDAKYRIWSKAVRPYERADQQAPAKRQYLRKGHALQGGQGYAAKQQRGQCAMHKAARTGQRGAMCPHQQEGTVQRTSTCACSCHTEQTGTCATPSCK